MPTTDTDVQQLVINVGTTAQIQAAISGGTITQDMLSVVTDDALTSTDVTTALGYTPAKTDLSNITNNAGTALNSVGVRTVVNKGSNSTNNRWWRLYSDGWIEQGGYHSGTTSGSVTYNLIKAMKDTNYSLVMGVGCPNVGSMHGKDYITEKTTTSFTYTSASLAGNFTNQMISWFVCGWYT